MNIKGLWRKFLDCMRLPKDDDNDCDDFEGETDVEENEDAVYLSYYDPIFLPDGGFLIKIIRRHNDLRDNIGFVVISKNYNASVIPADDIVFDYGLKLALVKHITKFCNALKS